MSAAPTVLASMTRAVIDYGAERGVSRPWLLRMASLDEAALAREDARIGRDVDEAVWRALERSLGEHGLGLGFAQTKPGPRAYGVVALRDMTCATYGDALRRHCRHHRVLKEHVGASLVETEDAAQIELSTASGRLACSPAMAEAALAPYAIHAREWTGQDVDPLEVQLEHDAPADTSAYERLFRCPVRFSQPRTAIRFARSVLELPLTGAQHELCEYLEQRADEALALAGGAELVVSCEQAVRACLESGDVRARAIAKRMCTTPRTLQRRLAERGLSLRMVIDRVREQHALALLRDPSVPMTDVSERLGFSEPRAFRRAFSRWTGLSPDRYRRARGRAHA